MRGLEHPLNVLLNEHIDLLVATSIVANLNMMVAVAEMNAGLLICIINVDVEDLGMIPCQKN